ncbi:MAG: RHS repeat-associated core domain-containing protein [Clostridia bacterium]|nr:RHS repeat-associated core domain-containing protein [Clostridia bacterium]
MKRIKTTLSFILSFVMLLCFLPNSVLAQIGEVFTSEENGALTELPGSDTEVYVLGEVTENRTETSKTFRMSDGSYVAADYGKPIHFEDENGIWQDYDNTLAFTDTVAYDTDDFAGFINTDSYISVKLANNSNANNLLKIQKDDYKISLHLVGANKSKALELHRNQAEPTSRDIDSVSELTHFSSGAIYRDILPDTDLEYIIYGNSVKENIIVKEKGDSYVYNFELKLNGLVPALRSDGSIALNDEDTEKTVLVIPKGYMYDANGERSTDVNYSIVFKNGNKYTLTVTADAEWINADERAFPVTVDPTVKGFENGADTVDAPIFEADPTYNGYVDHRTYAGIDSDYERQTLIMAESLPVLPKSAVILNAVLNIKQESVTNGGATVAARKITSTWSSSTVNWNNKPTSDTEILDYKTLTSVENGTIVSWDVTRAAQGWYSGSVNYGILLSAYDDTLTGYVRFYSSDSSNKPVLLITYMDTKGIEGIWTYSTQGGGSAGTGYVNGFNGNLVLAHGDITTKGGILPISVSHVYNSFLSGMEFTSNGSDVNAPITASYTNMKMGKGFKLSLQETLVSKDIDGTDYFVYNDGDGTEHYYYLDETLNKYIAESGNGFELTVGSNGNTKYTITDELGNKKYFNTNGYVTRILDVHGNKKEFVYNSSNQLTSVTSTTNGQTTETQLTLTYNANGALSRITDGYDTNKYIAYYYSSAVSGSYSAGYSGYLRKIEYFNDGQSLGYSLYNYNANGLLTDTYDSVTGYKLNYTYTAYNGNQRVASVTESVNDTNGQTVGFEYGDKTFTVRTSGKDDAYGTSDDLLTTYVFDDHGKATSAYSTDIQGNEVFGASYAEFYPTDPGNEKNNKIKTSAVKGITHQNYFVDGNLETASGWSKDTLNGGSATYTSESTLFGNKAMKLATTDAEGHAMYFRFFNIPEPGTYTLSAYVKTVNVTGDGGLSVNLDGTSSETLRGTTNTAINNGWRRISITKMFASAGSYSVDARLEDASGTAYIDCIQLEKSETPSDFNFVDNGGFEAIRKWSGSYTLVSGKIGSYGAKLNGNPTAQNRLSQTIPVNAPLNTTFMLSGWAKANSVDVSKDDRKFGLLATLNYSDGTSNEQYVSFNADNVNWQYATLAIVPNPDNTAATVDSITISVCYDHNANTAIFDDIALTVEPSQTYVYDDEGNIESAKDAEGNESLLEYVNDVDLESYTAPTNEKYDYSYVDGTHDVKSVTRTSGDITQTLDYGYDSFGHVTSTVLSASGTNDKITSSATYTEDGNYLASSTNQLGKVTNYNYDTVTKLLKYVENANSVRTAYVYDEFEHTEKVYLDSDEDGIADTAEAQVSYLYASGRLSGIDTKTTDYSLTYDAFGNILTIKAGNNTLATYEYAANNGKLLKLTYGNGDYEEYIYDSLDRLVSVKFNGTVEYTLIYDANGRLYSMTEGTTTHVYEYDSLDRLIRAYQKDENGIIVAVENTYDELGRAKGSSYAIGDKTMEYSVTYKTDSNLVSSLSMPDASEGSQMSCIDYTYDNFDRLTEKVISMSSMVDLSEEYSYYNYTGADGKRHTTSLVSSIALRSTNDSGYNVLYTYTYDNLGNITDVCIEGIPIEHYEYDALGQLIRADSLEANSTVLYQYDKAGNIRYTSVMPYTSAPSANIAFAEGSILSYGYSTSSWGDLLTSYGGTSISYDAIGNPTNWMNANNLTWEARELQSLSVTGGPSVSFEYNFDGIRTKKTVGGSVIHNYTLDGTKIIRETVTNNGAAFYDFYYLYDESGSVIGFIYNNNYYYYQKNLQGDVIRILNYSGNVVVEYTFDAWGKVLSVSGSLASTIGQYNPFRYRSYYYDTETGFYYLQSRYYDPVVGRFLNADHPELVGANGGIQGYNLFAYCNNNPANCEDSLGGFLEWIKNKIKSYVKNVAKPALDMLQENLKNKEFTYSSGVNLSGSPSVSSFNCQIGFAMDSNGDVAVQTTFGGGFTTGSPGASITAYQTVTNAPNIDKLNGGSYQIGGSAGAIIYGVPVSAGGDLNIIPDKDLDNTYYGVTTNVGFGTPGAEFHVEWSETTTQNHTRFNVFEAAKRVYSWIMEW